MSKKVLVAMSGGVDSSVAAALLVEQGYDVMGITLQIWPEDTPSDVSHGSKVCCSLSTIDDARRVAATLDIPHYVLNFRDIFDQTVIKDFISEYSKGRTPNPCIRCNQYIKFESLRNRAMSFGCDYLVTGHYARIEKDENSGRYMLLKGVDESKDQSYFLYVMTQEQLATTLFPVGSLSKKETRQIAHDKGLPVATKPESQEICFVPDKDYANFVQKREPATGRKGPIKTSDGSIVAEHNGIINYTIGQRKGLGISAPTPLYVTEIDPIHNAIVVGPEDELFRERVVAEDLNWIAFEKPPDELMAGVKIRYKAVEEKATINKHDSEALITFNNPQKAPAPGQAAVFYDGDKVLGGGTISKTL